MNAHIFHINPYDLAFLGVIFTGLNFALLLGFTKRISQSANRFLALALVVMVLWMVRISAIDIRLPLQFSLAPGPLVFFYVLKLTRPEYKFSHKDLLHFIPALLEQAILLNPVLQLLAPISMITYLYCCHRLIERYYRRQKFNGGDRNRAELRWLHKLLAGFGLLWLLWIPYTAIGYFYYQHQLSIQLYYPFYLAVTVMLIWIAAIAYLRPEVSIPINPPAFLKPSLPAVLKQKGAWLKNALKANLYHQDPELSLTSLAEKLGLTTHELSRTINSTLKKSFNDFINEYRVAEVVQKMQDPAYDHLTMMGIAYDCGFNSPSTFHRAFKEMTGKTPAEYKKELPSYNLTYRSRFAAVISYQETTLKWSHDKLNRNNMFRNYLKIAWRSIARNRVYTAINVLGLSLGVCACLVIYLVTSFELSYDTFHPGKDRIYRITTSQRRTHKETRVRVLLV